MPAHSPQTIASLGYTTGANLGDTACMAAARSHFDDQRLVDWLRVRRLPRRAVVLAWDGPRGSRDHRLGDQQPADHGAVDPRPPLDGAPGGAWAALSSDSARVLRHRGGGLRRFRPRSRDARAQPPREAARDLPRHASAHVGLDGRPPLRRDSCDGTCPDR